MADVIRNDVIYPRLSLYEFQGMRFIADLGELEIPGIILISDKEIPEFIEHWTLGIPLPERINHVDLHLISKEDIVPLGDALHYALGRDIYATCFSRHLGYWDTHGGFTRRKIEDFYIDLSQEDLDIAKF